MRWTACLLLLISLATMAYDFAPNRWGTFAALQGLVIFVLLWRDRRAGKRSHFALCAWGMWEFGQVFVCQGLQNFATPHVERFQGMCEPFLGIPSYAWSLFFAAIVAGLLASEVSDGHRPPDR